MNPIICTSVTGPFIKNLLSQSIWTEFCNLLGPRVMQIGSGFHFIEAVFIFPEDMYGVFWKRESLWYLSQLALQTSDLYADFQDVMPEVI